MLQAVQEDVYWPPNGSSLCEKKPKLGQHSGVRWILCPTPVILDGVIDFFYQRFILKLVDFGMTKDAMKTESEMQSAYI